MTTFYSDRWAEFMGEESQGLFIIVDGQVAKPRGQLRSMALFSELGLEHATYNSVWHTDLCPVPYTYHRLMPGLVERLLTEHGHLVQFISQATIDNSTFNFTAELIRLALRPAAERPLVVLVCDTQKLVLPGAADGKSIFEDFGLARHGVFPQSYSTLYLRYLRREDSPVRQNLTENLYFHRLAGELKRMGWNQFDRLPDLFRLADRHYPLTPMVLALVEYFLGDHERREAVEYSKGPPFIMEEMRAWLERGEATAVANALWYGMAMFDFDMDKLIRWKGENCER